MSLHAAYLTASKEQLQAELEMTKRTSHVKNLKILKMEDELVAKQKGMAFIVDQFVQLKQQGRDKENVTNNTTCACVVQSACT